MLSNYGAEKTLESPLDCVEIVTQKVKNLPVGGRPGSIPGLEDPLEREMATHFSFIAWRIP